MSVSPFQFDVLHKSLGASALRHKVISHNVANVNTPGYRGLEVSFEDQLKIQLNKSSPQFDTLQPEVREVEGVAQRADGNTVDIDRELAKLNTNALLYQTYAQILASKLSTMRSAITGR